MPKSFENNTDAKRIMSFLPFVFETIEHNSAKKPATGDLLVDR